MNLKSKIFTKYFINQLNQALNGRLQLLKDNKLDQYKITTEKDASIAPIVNTLDTAVLQLKKHQDDINNQINQKNREIAQMNKQLKVSEEATIKVFKEVEEVHQMKTEFISLASHQLRTPLVAMKWGLEMLLNGDVGQLSVKQVETLNDLAKSTERLIDLVNGLLNVSRIESNRFMINPEPTNLKRLAQEVINEINPKAQEKTQTILITADENLPSINIDPRLLRHVYMNLLTNAVKYSPQNTQITVQINQKGDEIINKVIDQGFGIPDADKKKVFEKFFRARNAVKIATDGTGLGLYLAKAIIEAMQGIMWFDSEENKGTTFWFTLPVAGVAPKEGEVSIS